MEWLVWCESAATPVRSRNPSSRHWGEARVDPSIRPRTADQDGPTALDSLPGPMVMTGGPWNSVLFTCARKAAKINTCKRPETDEPGLLLIGLRQGRATCQSLIAVLRGQSSSSCCTH